MFKSFVMKAMESKSVFQHSCLVVVHTFFISNPFFFNWASALFNFFMNWASNVAYVLFNTFNHCHTEALFTFTIFVPMSRPRSVYIVSMWSIFHFHLHFHYDFDRMNANTLILLLIFRNMSYYFWMITCMRNVNNFQ